MKTLKPVCITEYHELIMIDDSGRLTEFRPITQGYLDEVNTVEYLKDNYGYLWSEGDQTQTEDEYFQNMLDALQWEEGLYIGHDTSYTHQIPSDLDSGYSDHVGWECTGSGSSYIWPGTKVLKAFDQKLVDQLLAAGVKEKKERDIKEKAFKALKKQQKMLEKAGARAVETWKGPTAVWYVITGEAV
jgi:hypothetical protein